jgi:tetratricopeptide (TPR) repeat protein
VGRFHYELAHALHEGGDDKAAQAQYREALRRDPAWPDAANRSAWSLATHPNPRARNGAVALRLAQQICEATEYRQPNYLDTLAAAYAEEGQFEEAQSTARQALALAEKSETALVGPIQDRVRHYAGRQPFRDVSQSKR